MSAGRTTVTVEQSDRGWNVLLTHPNGRCSRVATYSARFRAREHAERLRDELETPDADALRQEA